MTPSALQERFAKARDRVDVEAYIEAVSYVHDDGRS